MELVSGEDLFHVLRRGPMPVAQSLRIVEEVAEALGEARRQGIAHRDIKPSNIVLGERGEVKVLDFGLAKQMQEAPPSQDASTILTSATMQGTVLGTPQYMSPEQAKDAPLGPASDLFSLGAVLYECLAGKPAFSGANHVGPTRRYTHHHCGRISDHRIRGSVGQLQRLRPESESSPQHRKIRHQGGDRHARQ
jgi:serine/threonine-protein kinase